MAVKQDKEKIVFDGCSLPSVERHYEDANGRPIETGVLYAEERIAWDFHYFTRKGN